MKFQISTTEYQPIRNMNWGQVDSPESLETPQITEIIENLTKRLTKLKDTFTIYVWKKSNFKKQ